MLWQITPSVPVCCPPAVVCGQAGSPFSAVAGSVPQNRICASRKSLTNHQFADIAVSYHL